VSRSRSRDERVLKQGERDDAEADREADRERRDERGALVLDCPPP